MMKLLKEVKELAEIEEARSIEIMIKQSRGRYGRGLMRYE